MAAAVDPAEETVLSDVSWSTDSSAEEEGEGRQNLAAPGAESAVMP